MRAIDADALMDILADRLIKVSERYGVDSAVAGAVSGAMKLVDIQPTIKPERKTGRWIPQDFNQSDGTKSTAVYYYPKCSICGCCANYTNFCPNCGANMRGKQDETN